MDVKASDHQKASRLLHSWQIGRCTLQQAIAGMPLSHSVRQQVSIVANRFVDASAIISQAIRLAR